MKKHDERTPEEIAREFEEIGLAEIDAHDLQVVFGGSSIESLSSNCSCGIA
ncbi:MAG TPA: hypothetical protein VGH73_12970 [Thermoanaerobaculia bacterium]|jgi:hypothetical protein